MKHTPGPWRAEPHTLGARPNWFVNAAAEMKAPYVIASGLTEANARLIAAAPELLTFAARVADGLIGIAAIEAAHALLARIDNP